MGQAAWAGVQVTSSRGPGYHSTAQCLGCPVSTSSELECYDICSAGWNQYVPGLRDCIESGTGHRFNGR
jgi:hypothetical protein